MARKPNARKLKTYVTSMGFYDLAVAAPSMKAAMEAWGLKHNVFHRGMAAQTDDPAITAAALEKPGIVLRRPVGTKEPFREEAGLPAGFSLPSVTPSAPQPRGARKEKKKKPSPPRHAEPQRQPDHKGHRAAIISFEKARAARERARAKEEAAAQRLSEKRASAVGKAEAALERARKDHQARREKLTRELDRRLAEEEARWNKERHRLEAKLDKARKT